MTWHYDHPITTTVPQMGPNEKSDVGFAREAVAPAGCSRFSATGRFRARSTCAARLLGNWRGIQKSLPQDWVDADYTSQACPICGHIGRENRPYHGLLFLCAHCGHTLHADLVAARNISMRTLLVRQDWVRTGRLSAVPEASDCEAKAARLSRYAELRWSLDARSVL
jgi:hypothetical protein